MGKKKDKKKGKNKEVETVDLPEVVEELITTNEFLGGDGTVDDPFITSDNGPTAIRTMDEYGTATMGEVFYTTPIGLVRSNKGEKRTTWQLDGVQIRRDTLNNLLCGTEINKEMIEKYMPEGEAKEELEETTKDKPKVKKKKDKEPSNLLLTEDQLSTKYTKASVASILMFKQLGKKKQRKAVEDAIEKKKVKGQALKDILTETFPDITEADLFSIFEALEEA